ncbi:MAG TPA: SpoIID/LytB domain-containing protein [Thermoanaerobaculia bacterium]|nr:SpoIID/LytB domain-containing protein [Thermoanaerobaculia bacterium]
MSKAAVSLVLATLLTAACAQAPPPRTAPLPEESARPSTALTPLGSVPRTILQPSIRVGLLSDQQSVTFPRIAGGYYLIGEAGPSILRRGFTARAPLADATVRFAVQMAAISDESSANALAERLRGETGQGVDVAFDPASGQRRVLAGDFASSEEATPFRAGLVERGYGRDIMVVRRPSDQPFERLIQITDDEDDRHAIRGESLLVLPVSAESLVIDQKPYRTAARLFVNGRGLLNVINELNLEEYLYGVVPAELGPRVYDELEALKAQAVAARTYAVRNLGQFRAEGYDICPGPACQAYIGFSGEEALSTQAVRETAGLILTHEGKPIDALYTSTCGGETSDVSTMFPGRTDPYLRRVRCVEMEMVSMAGRSASGFLTEQQANARLFAALAGLPEQATSWGARDVERAVAAAFRILGFTPPAQTAAASSRRRDVLRYLGAAMGLAGKARRLTLPEDRQYWFARSAGLDDEAYLAASFLIKYGIWPAQFIDAIDLAAAMPREELYALLGSWLREHAAIQEANGKIFAVDGRIVTLKAEGKLNRLTLPENVPLFRRLTDRLLEYATLPIMIGDRATVFIDAQRRPLGMVVQANYDGASFDRTSSFANWTRSYRADELVATINRRQPIKQLHDIRPLVVDASNRIAQLEVTAEEGRTFVLQGLPVRWSLNVPDNLFVYEKTVDPDGVDRYTFFGKGWGHGTGMCQVGAYGAAFRGWTFDRILEHFYTGVEIVRMRDEGGPGSVEF